jgi:hypothetical protein
VVDPAEKTGDQQRSLFKVGQQVGHRLADRDRYAARFISTEPFVPAARLQCDLTGLSGAQCERLCMVRNPNPDPRKACPNDFARRRPIAR